MNPELFIESGQQDVVNVLFCYKKHTIGQKCSEKFVFRINSWWLSSPYDAKFLDLLIYENQYKNVIETLENMALELNRNSFYNLAALYFFDKLQTEEVGRYQKKFISGMF